MRPPAMVADHAVKLLSVLVARYGRVNVRRLLRAFTDQRPDRDLAPLFGVSRQTITRWRCALGSETQIFVVHADIQRMAGKADGSGKSPRRDLPSQEMA